MQQRFPPASQVGNLGGPPEIRSRPRRSETGSITPSDCSAAWGERLAPARSQSHQRRPTDAMSPKSEQQQLQQQPAKRRPSPHLCSARHSTQAGHDGAEDSRTDLPRPERQQTVLGKVPAERVNEQPATPARAPRGGSSIKLESWRAAAGLGRTLKRRGDRYHGCRVAREDCGRVPSLQASLGRPPPSQPIAEHQQLPLHCTIRSLTSTR